MAFVRKNLAGRYNNRWKAKTVNRVAFPAGLKDEQKFRYFQNRNATNLNDTLNVRPNNTFNNWIIAATNGNHD